MADAPSQVLYGKVVGRFVTFRADGTDDGTVPDEIPLSGSVTLTPSVGYMRWLTTTPPRTATLDKVICRVINGDLYPPTGTVPGAWVLASAQPDGLPDYVQWTAHFALTGTSTQPMDVTFDVPAGGQVDLASVVPATPQPGTVTVYSSADTIAAQAAAAAAAASAAQAASIAVNANAVVMLYLAGQPNVPVRLWAPSTAMPTATDGAQDGDLWLEAVSA